MTLRHILKQPFMDTSSTLHKDNNIVNTLPPQIKSLEGNPLDPTDGPDQIVVTLRSLKGLEAHQLKLFTMDAEHGTILIIQEGSTNRELAALSVSGEENDAETLSPIRVINIRDRDTGEDLGFLKLHNEESEGWGFARLILSDGEEDLAEIPLEVRPPVEGQQSEDSGQLGELFSSLSITPSSRVASPGSCIY